MKRFSLVMAALAFSAGALGAGTPSTPTPNRTPTPTPTAPTLELVFSGSTLFRKTTPGYRVIVPHFQAHQHHAYILYPKNEVTATANSFPVENEFTCDEAIVYQWSRLKKDVLTLDPPEVIEARPPLDASGIAGWLVHLSRLAKGNSFDDKTYNQTKPIKDKVAAQMDIDRGRLLPLVLGPPYHPVEWEFKDGNVTSNEKICGTSGIRLVLPIKRGTTAISLVSDQGQRLTLGLKTGHTTTVVIGNSLKEDIECPKKEPTPVDEHFKLHYKLLKKPNPKEYVPVRVEPEKKCTPPPGIAKGRRSQRGSDCLGAQWP